jgi:uncharacterized membrane protein YdcZ (DUF606 family)
MALESASYISQLNSSNPTSGDGVAEGDNHIRLVKSVLQTQWPNLGTVAVTATGTELNYSVGVTSAIQTQINGKLAQTNPTPTLSGSNITSSGWQAAMTFASSTAALLMDSGVVGAGRYALMGTTSDGNWYFGRSQLNNGTTAPVYGMYITSAGTVVFPANPIAPTFGLSSISPSRALVTSAGSEINASSTTATELGYLSGVTSAVQTQLNAKLDSSTAASTYAPKSAPTFSSSIDLTSGNISASSGRVVAVSNAQTGYVSAALEARSGSGDVYIALHAGGASAAALKHTRGGSGISVVDNSNVAAPVTASDFTISSDRRKKQDIRPISHALDLVCLLDGFRFTFKETGKQSVGFIAQDVQLIFPELVSTDSEGFLSVSYGQVVSVLVEAIKELKAEVDALKAR